MFSHIEVIAPFALCVIPLLLLCAAGAGCGGEQDAAPSAPANEDGQSASGGDGRNRLAGETSPYLLQHADNPVDWYPWSDAAFATAKREDKPVFLSVGYSTCHWCHVMETESFEREDVAAILNEHYVAIKVDREERPDIDHVYMLATQIMAGRGGWPNSVWLTPDGKPWFAGTYFPREDINGRPGFKTVLVELAAAWRTRRNELEQRAEKVADFIQKHAAREQDGPSAPLSPALLARAAKAAKNEFDRRNGGFGGAPKFPPHARLRFLLAEHERTGDSEILVMITRTLDAMARGGIHDHLGGGFHRYATDGRWFVPHFEKTLYDNAQLARSYTDAFAVTGDDRYRRVAADIFAWARREMTGPDGEFHAALDADSDGGEGVFYLWRKKEILDVLGKRDGALFCDIYGVVAGGNYHEEATGEQTGLNILHLGRPLDDIARDRGEAPAAFEKRVDAMRQTLLDRRAARVRPHTDDKVLAAWNGLMISAMARAGRILDRPDLTAAAEKAAGFALENLVRDGTLLRSRRAGTAGAPGYLDDYAFIAEGLLDLYETTGRSHWLERSASLADAVIEEFGAGDGGGFFLTSGKHGALIGRVMDPADRAVPAGNAIAASVLVRLAAHTNKESYRDAAGTTLRSFAGLMQQSPGSTASLLVATGQYLAAAGRTGTAVVTVQPRIVPPRGAPGETVTLETTVTIDANWHINAADPADTPVPTRLLVDAGAGITPEETVFPDAQEVQLPFGDKPLAVYSGTIRLKTPLAISADADPGPRTIAVTVSAQACNQTECIARAAYTGKTAIEIDSITGGR